MAQDVELKVDIVGVQRRNVQVIMKKHSFSEYLKDHVTYIIGPDRFQKIYYNADTCNVIEFISTDLNDKAFEQQLIVAADEANIRFAKTTDGGKATYTITDRVRPKKVYPKKKTGTANTGSETKPPVMVESAERKAADTRYFTVQKRTDEDKLDHVKVLGWGKDR